MRHVDTFSQAFYPVRLRPTTLNAALLNDVARLLPAQYIFTFNSSFTRAGKHEKNGEIKILMSLTMRDELCMKKIIIAHPGRKKITTIKRVCTRIT